MACDHTTFLIIKPCSVSDGHIGDIISALERAGFDIVGVASRRLTIEEAAGLYDVHEGKDFFEPLIRFITSGPSVGILMRGPDISALRELIGKTDPATAARGTIRAMYGRTLRENAVHASDSPERVEYESSFYFGDCPRALTSRPGGPDGRDDLED
ncbi:MAG: nucleoside-diphosphate kinase [Candidatus Eisenbacteria bacterium]|nr:nucleoside-diphosphate kinase [Candidatus Eisenbacteria bacterium]